MKNLIKPFMFSLIILFFMAFAQTGLAQEPPHPPSEKGTDTNHSPAGAPIGSGVTILLAMGAAYGLAKLYQMRNRVSVTE
jgi:hypothetical protein